MSNYVNGLIASSRTRYNYNTMMSKIRGANDAPLVYGSRKDASYVNESGVNYLKNIREGAKKLQASLQNMGNMSTFQKMTAVSSSTEHLSIQSGSAPAAKAERLSVGVQQIAAGQRNLGAEMKSAEIYGGGLGKQQFEIEVDGKKTQASIEVKAGDTNKVVQQKMADAINASGSGVRAQVILNSSKGVSTLSVESQETGDSSKARFQMRDVSGGLIAATGAATVNRDARNALFTVDGVAKTSSTNNVDLGNGVKATLKKATDEGSPVSISMEKDKNYALDKVRDLVSNYNNLLDYAKRSDSNKRLQNDLTTTVKSYAPSLERVGVTTASDGKLEVDSTKLEASYGNGNLERVFSLSGGSTFGIVGRLENITRNVERTPAYYVNRTPLEEPPSAFDPYDFEDQDTLATIFNSKSFNLARYNQMYNLGYLFDIWA